VTGTVTPLGIEPVYEREDWHLRMLRALLEWDDPTWRNLRRIAPRVPQARDYLHFLADQGVISFSQEPARHCRSCVCEKRRAVEVLDPAALHRMLRSSDAQHFSALYATSTIAHASGMRAAASEARVT
jgi:hypothetical protein